MTSCDSIDAVVASQAKETMEEIESLSLAEVNARLLQDEYSAKYYQALTEKWRTQREAKFGLSRRYIYLRALSAGYIAFDELFKNLDLADQETGQRSIEECIMVNAAGEGHLNVVKLMHRRGVRNHHMTFIAAAANGKINVMDWILQIFKRENWDISLDMLRSAYKNSRVNKCENAMVWIREAYPDLVFT